MSGFGIELFALAVVLSAAVIQLLLEYFRKEKPAKARKRWAYILTALVILGALGNGVGKWMTHTDTIEERKRLEQVTETRERTAQQERQVLSAQIQGLAGRPGLTDQEALIAISGELQNLREQASSLELGLQGMRRYSKVAKYNVLGLTGRAGVGLQENSPIERALNGAFMVGEGPNGPTYTPQCSESALAQFGSVAQTWPDFPFSHWALATCLRQTGNLEWQAHAERALEIFKHTTQLAEHSSHHDQAQAALKRWLNRE